MEVHNTTTEQNTPQEQVSILSRGLLQTIYRVEHILTRRVASDGDNEITVTFQFPEYDRTLTTLGHVSEAQMHPAIIEGALCLIAHALREKTIQTDLSYGDFIEKLGCILYRGQTFTFREQISPNTDANLKFKIIEISRRGKFYIANISVEGFVSGTMKAVLPIIGWNQISSK